MTVKELKEQYKGKCAGTELYRYRDGIHEIHADSIFAVNDDCDDQEVCDFKLMGESEYNKTIYAHSTYTADFDDYFGDKNAKVLIIVLPE